MVRSDLPQAHRMTDDTATDADPRWAIPPEDYFHVPGRDGGLEFLHPPGWAMRRVSGARVRQYACSEYPRIQKILERHLEPRWTEIQPAIFEFNTVPILAHDVRFRAGTAEVGGKCLMNGASGDRAYARWLKQNPGMPSFRRANRYFAAARAETTLTGIPLAGDTAGLPVGIECRNRTNYYHFMTETLPLLVHFVCSDAPRITIHCRNDDPSGFSQRFVEALFAELAGRVQWTDRAAGYDKVLMVLNFRHLVYANGDPMLADPLQDTGEDAQWRDLAAHLRRRKFVFKNSYDVSLRLLRERAVAMLDPVKVAAAPKRIWVSRSRDAGVNQRPLLGEDRLLERLTRAGFRQVFFETMTPLEQITAIQGAEVIGAAHGAFFANMMFARPETHFIELGSLQTMMHRWGDFLGNAHAAGCRYSMVFADLATDSPDRASLIGDGLVGVRVGDRAIDLIARLADSAD